MHIYVCVCEGYDIGIVVGIFVRFAECYSIFKMLIRIFNLFCIHTHAHQIPYPVDYYMNGSSDLPNRKGQKQQEQAVTLPVHICFARCGHDVVRQKPDEPL